MSRIIGGNPLRNAAIRQGAPLPRKVPMIWVEPSSLKPRPYTEEDRAKLLAPITIRSFGGKTYAGTSSASGLMHRNGGTRDDDNNSDRYAQRSDWADLDRLER